MSKVPIKVLLDETMRPFMPFITTSAVQLQDGEHSLEDLETAVANSIITGSYDNLNKKIILTAQNGHTVEFSIADIIYGLQSEITSQNKLSSDLVDDTNNTNKFVTANEKTNWDAKYVKPIAGIPISDLSSTVQTSLGKADTAIQDVSDKQDVLVSGTNIKTINNESIVGSGNVNISGGQTIQYETMPTASADNLGDIVQYIGTTTNDYTNGYFYKCVENSGVYIWESVSVQNVPTSKYYVSGNYLIYNISPGDYKNILLETGRTEEIILPQDELKEGITLAGKLGKSLMFIIPIYGNYFGENQIAYLATESIPTITSGNNKYLFFYTNGMQMRSGNVRQNYAEFFYSADGNEATNISRIKWHAGSLLSIGNSNTSNFTPTGDYNPATKKYVDDSISSAVGNIETALQTITTGSGV